jgi:hypothetical protein
MRVANLQGSMARWGRVEVGRCLGQEQVGVGALPGHEVFVGALFDDPAIS